MFVHHVFFWLKNPDNAEERNKLKAGLEMLSPIEPKIEIHVGTPASTRRPVIDSTYDFSLLLIFDNMEDHDHYQEHPLHKKFVEECAILWRKVQIYDSE